MSAKAGKGGNELRPPSYLGSQIFTTIFNATAGRFYDGPLLDSDRLITPLPKAGYVRTVLGIDAAWTLSNPSGVALAREGSEGWELIAVSPSYLHFLAVADPLLPIPASPSGSIPSAKALLHAAQTITGQPVSVVAIDMPMSRQPITTRRASDQAISKEYGSRWASTHTPSSTRPGKLSDDLRSDFENNGYPLRTQSGDTSGLIEVYPHPALIELASADKRLPYKLSKIRSYWPSHSRSERLINLKGQWSDILALLDRHMAGASSGLPILSVDPTSGELKAYEDMLDAIVCAWVGTSMIAGRAIPFGDSDSSIWVPRLAQNTATDG